MTLSENDELRVILALLAAGGLALLIVVVLLVRSLGGVLAGGRSRRRLRRRGHVGPVEGDVAAPRLAPERGPTPSARPKGDGEASAPAGDEPLGRNVTYCYDKALYHEPMVPPDLPPERSFVPTGLFLAWAVEAGLTSSLLRRFGAEMLIRHRNRDVLPWALYRTWHGSLDDDMLSGEGNAFASEYFDFSGGAIYDKDFRELLARDAPTPFHVEGDWDEYDRLKPRLDQRLATWREGRK
jgi:hypothetical protein